MRHIRRLPIFAALAVLLAWGLPALPQIAVGADPQEEASSLDEPLTYGYDAATGEVALSQDTSSVFCPDLATVVVHAEDVALAMDDLKAADNGDGTWSVPDPDTGATVVSKVQTAKVVFEDHLDLALRCPVTTALATIPSSRVLPALISSRRCYRTRRCYQCGNLGSCGPTGCLFGYYTYSQVRNHLVCRYTGNFRDRCLEFLSPVCRLNRYKCRNCTEGIVQFWPNYRWVCAVF